MLNIYLVDIDSSLTISKNYFVLTRTCDRDTFDIYRKPHTVAPPPSQTFTL